MRESINDLFAFLAVAGDRSFTRAAARLGVSQSALSRTIRKLEENLGVRLLTRTTRSVSPTEAGERLMAKIAPRLDEIEAELVALSALRDKPAGSVRITSSEHAADTILWPRLVPLLAEYPDLRLEIVVDNGFTDIAAERFDAGVRLGENVERDMIAVPISSDMRLVTVAAPAYFADRAKPKSPQELTEHDCINLRLATHGALYAWEFAKDGQQMRVRVEGQLTFTSPRPIIRAALAGFGIGFVPEDLVTEAVGSGELVQVLDDWCPAYAGFHLYYPSRRQNSQAFQLVVDALRWR